MFLEPDEIAHADAAFAYFDAGRPFDARGARVTNFATSEVRYLARSEAYRRLRYDAHAVVAPSYGTRSFFHALDDGAPVPQNGARRARALPYALAVYPSTYYAVDAACMRAAWFVFGRSISAAFFAGRLLNSIVFAIALVFAYLILRESHLTVVQRSLAFVGIAFFPMSTWMSAYIQPDNASALFLTIALYYALVLRRDPGNAGAIAGLGVAVAILGVTKGQYAVVAVVAFGLALRHAFDREPVRVKARALALGVALPLLAVAVGHVLSPLGALGLPPAGTGYAHADAPSAARAAGLAFARGIRDAWLGGSAFRSFWFHFGIRSEGAFSGVTADDATTALVALTAIAFLAWLGRQFRFFTYLRGVAARKGIGRALRSIGTDPSLNLYVSLSLVLFALFAFTDGYLVLQGRYWYPVLVPIVVVSVRAAGGVLRGRRARVATTVACGFWAAYALVTSPLSVAALDRGFYRQTDVVPARELGKIDSVEIDGRRVDVAATIRVRSGARIVVRGVGVDTSVGRPAADVRYRIDATALRRATTHLPDASLAVRYDDPGLAGDGFAFPIATGSLARGLHRVSIVAIEDRARGGLPLASLRLEIR